MSEPKNAPHISHRLRVAAAAFAASGLTLLVALFFINQAAGSPSDPNFGHKVTICHATSSASNPFTENTVDVASSGLKGGHQDHEGDIIPPFTYVDKDDQQIVYSGKNLSTLINGTTGSQLLANGCNPPPPPVDKCPNLPGDQATVPEGLIVDENGNCVRPQEPVDVCPNIAGNQQSVPAGMIVDANGNCVEPAKPIDACPNIDGLQATVPEGYFVDASGDCIKREDPPADLCPNIDGRQTTVPVGHYINAAGDCVTPTNPPTGGGGGGGETPTPPPATDVCANIDGNQAVIPDGLALQNGACIAPAAEVVGKEDDVANPDTPPAKQETATAAANQTRKVGQAPAPKKELPYTGAKQNALAGLGIALIVIGLVLELGHRRRHAA